MDPENLKKYQKRQNIDYAKLGLKKTYYGFTETPVERLRNLLSPTTNLASIIEHESYNGFERLRQNKQLQEIVVRDAKLVSEQFEDLHDYLHDVPIFYKYFDREGNPRNFKIWLKKMYDSFTSKGRSK